MRLILYTQYYRARTSERQEELDHCLRSNLQHPALDQVVVLRERDAPPLPGPARMEVQELEEAERLTYANWMQRLRQEQGAIGILINADIALGEGFEQLPQVLNTADSALALSRYNPQGEGKPARLNKFTHWTQDTWALRSDAPISDSLLYASSFPIGYPGCDNRIAYVLWSHGLVVKNPCYQLETLHHQADDNRHYDKNADRLYGGVSYVHPSLSLEEASDLEHTLWTRNREGCPGVLVNQQAIEQGVHQLLAKETERAQLFLDQQKSTGLAWEHPPLGCSRSAHASTWPLQELLSEEGVELDLNASRRLKGLQLRLPRQSTGQWQLQLEGRRQVGGPWQALELGAAAQLRGGGQLQFVELPVLHEPWQQLRLRLIRPAEGTSPADGLLELLTFAEKGASRPTPTEAAPTTTTQAGRPFQLRLRDRRLEASKLLAGQTWEELHRYSNRFALQRREGRIAFVDRYWPTAVTFRDPELEEWSSEALREAFVWGFMGPVLEWKAQQFSTEKLYAEQLNFWQYPCRTEQDAFERHQRMEDPFWDQDGVHLYVGMPWATWIDKKTFPDQLLEAYRSRIKAMQDLLRGPLQVHSVCQHIRWKEHPHRFEQAGINQLWIAHKEKGWDTEGQMRLHSWPLYAVNVLDPERREGLQFVPVEKKTIFASFKGAHMKHYPSDIRLRLKELAHLEGYEIEVTDLWHFNKVVYNYQIANKESDKEAIERQEIVAYNRLLSQSLFSLCPGGAGPNTLRLWESLGTGAIPVVLSDRHELPSLNREDQSSFNWDKALVLIPESDVRQIEEILGNINTAEAEVLQANSVEAHKLAQQKTCFCQPNNNNICASAQNGLLTESPNNSFSHDIEVTKVTRKLLVIGSSVSIQKEGYLPALKEIALKQYGIHLEVLNASLGGCSTEASLAYLKGDLFYDTRGFGAEIAIIEKTPNERHFKFAQLTASQKKLYEKRVYESTMQLCHLCQARGIRPILLTSYFKPNENSCWDRDAEHGYLRRAYEKAALDSCTPLIDIYSNFQTHHNPGELLLDDVHLNKHGAEAMALAAADALFGSKSVLKEDPPRINTDTYVRGRELIVLYKGNERAFSNRLLNTFFTEISHENRTLEVSVSAEALITGFFYISDQSSTGIKIASDASDEVIDVPTFDHMSFMPRVTYKSITPLIVRSAFRMTLTDRPADISQAMKSYYNTKTFDPNEQWAIRKYLTPLRERLDGQMPISEKIIAVFGTQS